MAATGIFFLIDVTFLASNLLKLLHGGWFPLLIGVCVFTLMLTWKQGRRQLSDKLREDAIELDAFLEAVFINPPTRVSGTAVFLSSEKGSTPNAAAAQPQAQQGAARAEHLCHRQAPRGAVGGRREALRGRGAGQQLLAGGAALGFKNEPDVPEALEQLKKQGVQLEDMETATS